MTVIRYFACHQLSPALLNGHEAFVASLEMCMVGSGSSAFRPVIKDCIIGQLLCQVQHISETENYALVDVGGFRTIEDIMKVPGIKNAAFQKIKDKITV